MRPDDELYEPLESPLPEAPLPAGSGYTGHHLGRAFRRARRCAQDTMPPGRHPRELALLTIIREQGPISQRALGDLIGVNRTIMVKVVDALHTAGLVRRDRDPDDRRSYALTLTDAGRVDIAALDGYAETADAAFTAPLDPAERDRLHELLGRLLPVDLRALPPALTARTAFLVVTNHFRIREKADRALRGLGLEPRQFTALSTLAEAEPCSQQRLAGRLGVTGPAVVQAVDELDRSGRIGRSRNPDDRREHVLRLTDRGRSDLAAARGALDEVQRSLTGRLGPDLLTELNDLLGRLT